MTLFDAQHAKGRRRDDSSASYLEPMVEEVARVWSDFRHQSRRVEWCERYQRACDGACGTCGGEVCGDRVSHGGRGESVPLRARTEGDGEQSQDRLVRGVISEKSLS